MRAVAAEFGVSVGAVAYWVEHARGRRIDRISFANDKPGRPWNRISAKLEQRILRVRASLREHSVLGEYGPDAIGLALREQSAHAPVPGQATIARVLARRGMLDGVHRQRRPAPPKGWHLPEVAAGDAELDSFDFIEDLKIATGPLVSALTAMSLHVACPMPGLWPRYVRARPSMRCWSAGARRRIEADEESNARGASSASTMTSTAQDVGCIPHSSAKRRANIAAHLSNASLA